MHFECENSTKATCVHHSVPVAASQSQEGGGATGSDSLGDGAGSCLLNSISLFPDPGVQKLYPFIFIVSTSLCTAKASFLCTLYFLAFLGFSGGFSKNRWTASEKRFASRNRCYMVEKFLLEGGICLKKLMLNLCSKLTSCSPVFFLFPTNQVIN